MSRKCLGWVGKKASDWMGKEEEEEENEVVEASAHKKQRQEVKRKQAHF